MAAFVQSRRETGNPFVASTSAGVTLPAPSTPGNTLVAILNMREGEDVVSVVDDGGNVYTLADSHFHSGDAVRCWIYVSPKAMNVAQTVTFTITNAFDNATGITMIELSGLAVLGPVSSGEASGPGPTVPNSGDVTTTTADAVLIGAVASSSTAGWTVDADFTAITTDVGTDDNGHVGYQVLTTIGTHNWTPSAADNASAVAVLVAIQAAPLQVDWNWRARQNRPAPFKPGRAR